MPSTELQPWTDPSWSEPLSLADLRAGETALVATIDASSAAFCERMHSRGLCPGVPVTVVRSSDPLVVSCGCSRWGIARREATRIGVARLAKPTGTATESRSDASRSDASRSDASRSDASRS